MYYYILASVIFFVAGVVAGNYLGYWIITAAVRKNPSKTFELLLKKSFKSLDVNVKHKDQKTTTSVIEVYVEQQDNQFYLWDNKSGDFVGQGLTLELAIEAGNSRYPSQQLIIV